MRRIIEIIICIGIATVLLSGCKLEKNINKEDVTRVSVILPHRDDGYWSLVQSGIEERINDAVDNNIDIKIEIPQLNYSIEQMTDIIYQQIAAKVDVLVVQGNTDVNFIKALNEAASKGIRIICIDTDIEEGIPDHLYIGTDNYAAGQMIAEHMADETGGSAKAVIISGMPDYPNLEQREQAIRDIAAKYDGIEIVETIYDNYDTTTVAKEYFSISEDVDTLLCIEGTGVQAIGRIANADKRQYKYIFGFDIVDGFDNGLINGIVLQNQHGMGERLVEELIYYCKNNRYTDDKIYTDISWVNQENYSEVAVQ